MEGAWSQKCDKIVVGIFQLLTDTIKERDWVGHEMDWSFVDMYGRIDLELDKDLSRLLNILDASPSKFFFIILAVNANHPCAGQNSLASIGQGRVRSPIGRRSLQSQHILLLDTDQSYAA